MSEKYVTSADGLYRVNYKEVENVCISGSLYALMQYLLLFDEEVATRHTCYFLGYAVNEDISRKLPGYLFFLSRIKERAERHSRYVEAMSKALAGIFACGHQGEEMDAGISTRALVRALETFRKEQDVSRRDLVIYVGIETGAVSGMELAKRYQLTAETVYVIKHRMGHLLRKHGPRCFERAIRREGYISFTSAA